MCLFYFYKKIDSEMRNYRHRQGKIGYGFDMKRRIKIRRYDLVGKLPDNNLAKFQTNWSRGCWLGVQNAWTTCLNIYIEKQGKIEFRPQWDKWHLGPEPEAEHVPVSIWSANRLTIMSTYLWSRSHIPKLELMVLASCHQMMHIICLAIFFYMYM